MASGAQLNEWGRGIVMLSVAPSASAVSTPLASYGTIPALPSPPNPAGYGGQTLYNGLPYPVAGFGNDSGWYASPKGLSKVTFQLIGPGATAAGYSVSVYGTIDPAAYWTYVYGKQNPTANLAVGGVAYAGGMDGFSSSGNGYYPGVPATSSVLLPGPAEQSGTGTVGNPMVSGTSTMLQVSGAFLAYRVVVTTVGSPSNPIQVIGWAIP